MTGFLKLIKYTLWIILLSAIGLFLNNIFNVFENPNPRCNLQGKVVKLADGDSITVLDSDKTQHKVRLAGIDTPERGQAYWKVAKTFLSDQIAGKNVCIGWSKKDRYQRLVGVVRYHNKDINLSLVEAGLAWHYKAYQNEQSDADQVRYSEAEIQAKEQRLGLWRDKDAVAPWDWRRRSRK